MIALTIIAACLVCVLVAREINLAIQDTEKTLQDEDLPRCENCDGEGLVCFNHTNVPWVLGIGCPAGCIDFMVTCPQCKGAHP